MANVRKQDLSLTSVGKHVLRVFKDKICRSVTDGRSKKNKIWSLSYALEVLLLGMMGGAKTLREVESYSMHYSERIPDTTLEGILAKADPSKLSEIVARQVKQAARDHELRPVGLPFHMIAIDGKKNHSTDQAVNEQSCSINHFGKYVKCRHMNLRAAIVSSRAKLLLGERPIPKKSAETTELIPFVDDLIKQYGTTKLLQVVSVDAGMTHRHNATQLRERNIHFIMGLKKNQKTIHAKALSLLGTLPASAAKSTVTVEYSGKDITYRLYREKIAGQFLSFPEIQQIWRIEKEILHIGSGQCTIENRYYITSIPSNEISARQCITAVKAHWGIENNANGTFDIAFGEDDFPFTTRAMQLVSMMRMIAYNCMTRFKYRKLKRLEHKEMSWKKLFECFKIACFKLRSLQEAQSEETPAFV